MGLIPDHQLQDLRARNDIVEVVSERIPLSRAGSRFKALCPFHKEKTPSFSVDPVKQAFYCFGCHKGGGVIQFVMEYDRVDFMTAAKMLARRVGMVIEVDERARRDASEKDTLYKLLDEIAAHYRQLLLKSPEADAARDYLAARRLDGEPAKRFRFGFAPDRRDTALRWGEAEGYTREQLLAAGMIGVGDDQRPFDRFYNRLMIPIADEMGRVIGFTARVLRKEDHPAKYVNTAETPLFRKSRVLFALDRARKAILDEHRAILCEGQIDTIRCHLAGVENVVAAQGTAITEEHARILKRYADEVLIVLDADTAGRTAAMRAADLFLESGLDVRVAALPPGEDPDSLILKQGPDAFRQVLAAAVPSVVFQVRTLLAQPDHQGETGRRRAAHAVLQSLRRAPEAVQREQLLRLAARELGLSENALQQDLNHLMRRPAPGSAAARTAEPEEETPAAPADEPPPEELLLATTLCAHPEVRGEVKRYLPLEYLRHDTLRRVVKDLVDAETDAPVSLTALRPEDPAYTRLAARVEHSPRPISGKDFNPLGGIRDIVLLLWRREFERRRAGVREDIARAEGPKREALQLESQELTFKLKTLQRGWDEALPILEL